MWELSAPEMLFYLYDLEEELKKDIKSLEFMIVSDVTLLPLERDKYLEVIE